MHQVFGVLQRNVAAVDARILAHLGGLDLPAHRGKKLADNRLYDYCRYRRLIQIDI